MNEARGIYQPLAEKVPLYDLADEEIDEERSRVPLLIVIALVVLAAFAGVVWLAYNQGVARGRAGTSIVIEAPNSPVRVAPANAGGATPFTNLKVYSQPIPPDQEAQKSALAAPQVKARATTEAPPARLSPAGPPARVASQASAPPPALREAPSVVAPAAPRTVQAVPPPAPPAAAPTAPRAAQTAPPPAPPAAAPPAPRTAQAAPPPAAPPAPPPPRPTAAANSAAVSGAVVLQLGAFENEAAANGAWTIFRARYDSARTLSPDIQKVDLGAKGIWYRLRAGPFADRPAGVDACTKLKAAGATCFVTVP